MASLVQAAAERAESSVRSLLYNLKVCLRNGDEEGAINTFNEMVE